MTLFPVNFTVFIVFCIEEVSLKNSWNNRGISMEYAWNKYGWSMDAVDPEVVS